jgi:GntR family transcriptional regulator
MAAQGSLPTVTSMSIDRDGPIPPYRQIAAALRGRIEDGTIQAGRRIPSLVELEAEFGVARDTLRKAVQVLKDEGLVETVTGMGIYVVEQRAKQPTSDPDPS